HPHDRGRLALGDDCRRLRLAGGYRAHTQSRQSVIAELQIMQESIDGTRTGPNRTGQQTSPRMSKEMNDSVQPVEATAADASVLLEARLQFIRSADTLGSVPPPATAKGVMKTGAKMLAGNRPQVFIDKLAERLAYERGGTRLYDAVIAKFV